MGMLRDSDWRILSKILHDRLQGARNEIILRLIQQCKSCSCPVIYAFQAILIGIFQFREWHELCRTIGKEENWVTANGFHV